MLSTSNFLFLTKKPFECNSFKLFAPTLLLIFFSLQMAKAQNTVSVASSTPTVCINTALTWITHTTTGATGVANAGTAGANGLPAGVAASWNSNTITIYGTPSASGVFNYSIPLTGGSGSVNATGTITVAQSTIASTFTGTTPVCAGSPAQFTSGATSACSSLTQSLNLAGAGTASASLVITATDNFTIEGWIKPNTANGTTSIFYNNGFGLLISGTSLSGIVPGRAFLSSSANVTVGVWQHVALVRNATIWTIYLNGTAYVTSPTNTEPNNQNKGTFIGCNLNNGEIFDGKIGQVAFWNTVRTTAQIQADMQSCSISGSGLAAYWSLNGTANDLSGNGNNLTLSSTTYSTDAPIIQTGAQYVFNFGDGSSETSNGGSAARTYTSANTYTVSLTVTNACTTSTSSQSITVNPTPTANISGPSAACGSATLTASGGTSYSWTYGSPNNTATTTISGTSTPTVTVTNTFGCSATASQLVIITPNTVAGTISAEQTICSGSVGAGSTTIVGESNTSYNNAQVVRSTTNVGQSFIPSVNATLSSISLWVDYAQFPGTFTLQIRNGSGNSGSVLSTLTQNITSSGLNTFTLSSALSITSGTTYTMILSATSPSEIIYLRFSMSNPYAKGRIFINGSPNSPRDLYFQLNYTVPNANWSDLTLTGNTGTVKYWEQSSDIDFTSPTTISNTSTTLQSILIGNLNTNTFYRAVVQSGSCDVLNTNKIKITVAPNNWTGTTSNSWNVASNWSCGIIPSGNSDVTISSGTPILDINLNLLSGKSILLSGTAALTIDAGKTLSIASGGTADFGGKLVTLKSDATGTAAIGTIAGTLSNANNVTVERFIPRRRAFRFLSSPVNTSNFISNNWQQATHISGSTTGQNGFDQSVSGTASLYTYNASTEAWAAIPNTNATNLTIGAGYRMLIRGNRTINLNTTVQDSAALVLSATGSIVTGNVVFGAGSVSSSPAGIPALNAAVGSGANNSTVGWSLIGNPYACAVNWANVTKSNVSSTFATWNVNNAGRGSYVYHDGATGTGSNASNIINSGQAVFVQTIAANPSITFTEAAKVTSTPPSHFKKSIADVLNIDIFIGDRAYDALSILFDANNSNAYDVNDFIKLVNPEINFYSYLADGTKLAMNNMKEIKEETVIPLGLNGVFNGGTYELKFSNQNSFAHAEVKLKDKFINKIYDLKSINNLLFTVTTDSNSFGENRFELIFSKSATGLNNELSSNNNFMIFPNPANDVLNLSLTTTQEDNYSFSIYNHLGAIISNGNLDFNAKRTHALNIENLSNGVYFIQVKNGKGAQTIKFIK